MLPAIRIVRIGREEHVAVGVADYMLDRKLYEWVAQVRNKSEAFLEQNRADSPERRDLQLHLDLLNQALSAIETKSNSPLPGTDADIDDTIAILRSRFPELAIEKSSIALKEVANEIRNRINGLKSGLESTIEEWLTRLRSADEFEDAYLDACSIVAGTCVGIAGKRNLPERFDWAIIDEAGRATPSEVLIPMVRATKSILVGDHKQLPPVIEHELLKAATTRSDIDPIWLKQSLFEYFFNRLQPDFKAVLKGQYRMHPHIANLIGGVFYKEEGLESSISAGQRSHGWKQWPVAVVWYSTSNLENRFERSSDAEHRLNLCEVQVIEKQLSQLDKDLLSRKEKKSVAVIAGYRAQADQLSVDLEPDNKKRWKSLDIEINTVDAFQGREVDIVFYSVVRSNKTQSIGFLKDCRRLNVALSRARELLFIVGDHYMVSHADTHLDVNPFKDVIAHIVGHPAECVLAGVENDNR